MALSSLRHPVRRLYVVYGRDAMPPAGKAPVAKASWSNPANYTSLESHAIRQTEVQLPTLKYLAQLHKTYTVPCHQQKGSKCHIPT